MALTMLGISPSEDMDMVAQIKVHSLASCFVLESSLKL